MKKIGYRSVAVLIICLFVSNAKAQIRDYYDDRVFYYDDYGWSIALSLGTVLYDKLNVSNQGETSTLAAGEYDLKETLLPSFTLTSEYKPYKGPSFDTSITYFKHNIQGTGESAEDIGNQNKLIWFVGGNWHFDDIFSFMTPYVTSDYGLAFNNIGLNEPNEEQEKWAMSHAGQVGAGIDVDVGPIELGALYNYIFTKGFKLYYGSGDSANEDNGQHHDNIGSLYGHKIELKGTIKPSIFNE